MKKAPLILALALVLILGPASAPSAPGVIPRQNRSSPGQPGSSTRRSTSSVPACRSSFSTTPTPRASRAASRSSSTARGSPPSATSASSRRRASGASSRPPASAPSTGPPTAPRCPSASKKKASRYRVRVEPDGDALVVTVDLARPLPKELVGRAGFNLELFPPAYFGKAYHLGGTDGVFPRQGNGPT